QRLRTTIVFVTHDIDEALYMADRILVMSPRRGRIIDEIRVPAERPRQQDWLTSTTFAQLKRHCLALLSDPHGTLPLERLDPLSGLPRSKVEACGLACADASRLDPPPEHHAKPIPPCRKRIATPTLN